MPSIRPSSYTRKFNFPNDLKTNNICALNHRGAFHFNALAGPAVINAVESFTVAKNVF
jgi:hypothetical protein